MTDIVDDSIRGVEEAEGIGSECASGHVWCLEGEDQRSTKAEWV
jgi:hypothetical protein